MATLIRAALLIALLGLALFAPSQAQSCTQTVPQSQAASLVSIVNAAANGSVICLGNGDFGTRTFQSSRTGVVTVRSEIGRGATLRIVTNTNARFITFTSLTVAGVDVSTCSRDIQVRDSTFTAGLLVDYTSNSGCTFPTNHVFDGNTISGPAASMCVEYNGVDWHDGMIEIANNSGASPLLGVTLSNNIISNQQNCDGFHVTGRASGITFGPGNILDGITQGSNPDLHADAIQLWEGGHDVTITGNWFRNNSVVLQSQNGTSPNFYNVVFTNNIASNSGQGMQAGGASPSFIFEHNTYYNTAGVFLFGQNPGGGAFTGLSFRSNVLINTGDPGLQGTTGTVSHSMCNTGQACSLGTNIINGALSCPSGICFAGGANPNTFTTFAQWQLAAGSLGKNNAHDGQDRGVVFSGTPTPPAAPTDLRVALFPTLQGLHRRLTARP